MPSTISAFTPGDLVISVYGDAEGDGSYALDQASPIALEELTTSGAAVGALVLPETTTVSGGTTEYAVSGEYGSASEGALQLSADGTSLVILGYGVNDVAFNTQGATGSSGYGNAALGQSTSVLGGGAIAVPRIVADISANGAVDTSTALYNIYNTNNPRSVATVNGSVFYLSGQGVKATASQGVFEAADGASSATAIDSSTDTREAVIYNGVLYVSRDSTQGTGGTSDIASYGGLPGGTTVASPLAGIDGTLTLTAAQANTANAAAVGTTVHLSPQGFFFANATTLYVADSGFPKEGGLGDGGLQKWSYTGSNWVLDYTLSAGLSLVLDTAAAGTTGLYGITGSVSGGEATLYVTTSTAGETDPSFLYGITDAVAATTLPDAESFTQLDAAAPDTIIRGVAFAPAASTATPTSTTVTSANSPASPTVTSGSTLTVAPSGVIVSASILSGGSATILGTDMDAVIAHGGMETVSGVATGDDVAGIQLVSAATGLVSGETVENGGTVELFLKGVVGNAITVTTGGMLLLSGNAVANNAVIAGGTVALQSPKATLGQSLTFSGPGTLDLTAVASAGFGDQAVISGFGVGDVIDDTTVPAGATLSTALVTSGTVTNTLATLTAGATVQSFVFAGSAIGTLLATAADAGSGTEIVYNPPPPTSSVVLSGQTLSNAIVTSGSTLTVNAGGTIVSATVQSGGRVIDGGVDSGSTILAGGNETVLGSASADQIYGTQLVSAATATVTGETVFGGGALDLFLKGAAAAGTTVSSGGALNISGNATGVNTTVEGGATLDLQSPKATLTGSVSFAGPATLLVTGVISAGFGDLAAISGFGNGGAVDDAGVGLAGAVLTSSVVSGNTVETITNAGVSQSFIFAGSYPANAFALSQDNGSGAQITETGVPCYCPGTLIGTDRGEVAVERLAIGDRVLTVAGDHKPIRWIGRRSFAGRFMAGQRHLLPVLIRAGALGGGLPHRDLRVSPLHAMYLDGLLIPARALVNGVGIVQELSCRAVDYIHVELDEHDVILAEGAASETYLDEANRAMFHNAIGHGASSPEAPPRGGFCAPRVESGYALEAIRTRLSRAMPAVA